MISQTKLLDGINYAIAHLQLPAEPESLYQPIAYTLETGGKRLRPTLLLAACQALGGEPVEAMNAAVGIEMFHNFTLLHDDVMDNASIRRARPTVHCKWDTNTAILSGDAMLNLANVLMSLVPDESLRQVMDIFNRTALDVYEGQALDMEYEDNANVSPEQYINMIRLKTSVLIGGACKLGAVIAGAQFEDQELFYHYGENLGLAFQLQDDWLDTFGDPVVFGKEIGGDIINNKKTWLLISALGADTTGNLRQILKDKDISNADKIASVTQIYRDHNLDKLCRNEIEKYSRRAIEYVELIDMSSSDCEFFTNYAKELINRSY